LRAVDGTPRNRPAPGLTYEVLDGDAEVAPGLRVIPTPGHQSLVVEGVGGPVVITGRRCSRSPSERGTRTGTPE
jgi:glyoxylase-like metal-dependent hydrolase (beta-lactamase superfamily II)